jgi:hypothetical protein
MSFIKQLTTIANTAALTATLSLTLAVNNANAQTVRNADEPGRNPYYRLSGKTSLRGNFIAGHL